MMDFGPQGIVDTISELDQREIKHSGAGMDRNAALAPCFLEKGGISIGVMAGCDVAQISSLYATDKSPGVACLHDPDFLKRIRDLSKTVDFTIVQLHWGQEMCQLPSPTQRSLASQIVDAGANLILGHHPHVLQPIEQIDNVPVAYSLGHLLFSNMFWSGTKTDGEEFVG